MAIPDGRLNDVQETSEYDIARGTKKQSWEYNLIKTHAL